MTNHEERVRRAAEAIHRRIFDVDTDIDDIEAEILGRIPEPPSPWVSVEDRLPDDVAYVVAKYGDGEDWERAFYDTENGVWFFDYGFILDNVTYWMPLPPVPEDK